MKQLTSSLWARLPDLLRMLIAKSVQLQVTNSVVNQLQTLAPHARGNTDSLEYTFKNYYQGIVRNPIMYAACLRLCTLWPSTPLASGAVLLFLTSTVLPWLLAT